MEVWYLVFRPDSLTYTVAKALSFGGHSVTVWVTDADYDCRPKDNIQRRIAEIPGVSLTVREQSALPGMIGRLVVQVFPRPMESIADVHMLAKRARSITLISAGDRSREWRKSIKMQWFEARQFGPNYWKIDRVAYKDGFYSLDLHGLLKSRRPVGFDIHSQFLNRDESFRAIHEKNWDPETARPVLANFLGSQDPGSRKRILDTVRPYFVQSDGRTTSLSGKAMFWHEYSDETPAVMGVSEYLAVLSRSDFTLAPPGYSRVTHRPLEALLRGSIPVLHAAELDMYGVQLIDGINCIGVERNKWPAAMQRIAELDSASVLTMRRYIHTMSARLRYESASREMRGRLAIPS